MKHKLKFSYALLAASVTSVVAIMTGCSSTPAPAPSAPVPVAPPLAAAPPSAPAFVHVPSVSRATTPRDYRRDAATHIYEQNANRIFKGQMPPLLYAVGVLQVDVDDKGRVTRTNWMRAPSHAPEVVAEIERTVRRAAPYPVPARMGHVTYTDTWLWHKSGRFQLDTLTEGQL